MEISQNTTGFSSAQSDRLLAGASDNSSASTLIGEGRIEAVKDGVASVRVSANTVVQASVDPNGTGFEVGAKVALFQNADGTVTAKSAATLNADLQSQAFRILMDDLRTLMGADAAGALAKSLSKGDLDAARKQIAEIWQNLKNAPPEQVPPETQAWLDKKVPALLSRAGEAPVVPGGSVALSLGAPTAREGEYHAQVAGQPAKLMGPTDLPSGPKGLWQSRQIPGGGAVWAPASPLRTDGLQRPLPERMSADAHGAKELLDWAGVESTPQDADSLGQFLKSIADEFAMSNRDAKAVEAMPALRQNLTSASELHMVASEAGRVADPLAANVVPLRVVDSPISDTAEAASLVAVSQRIPTQPVELPKAVAERALVAWSLELPEDRLVRQAVLGQGPSVADSLTALAKLAGQQPGAYPVVERLLAELGSKDLVAPQGAKVHGQNLAMREHLAEAVFEALSRLGDGAGEAQMKRALQQTASALVQESLEPPRDGAHEYPPTVFQARNAEGKMEDGRIVVHDRRKKNKAVDAPSDHHTVEIEMRPAELGPIKAKLDLRGKVLTTRLEAREADTAALLEAHADELREAFKRIGLDPAKIDVDRPKPATRIDPRKRGSGTSLDLRV